VPQNYIKLTGAQATQMLRLVEALEEATMTCQHVYANFDIDESENPGGRRRKLIWIFNFQSLPQAIACTRDGLSFFDRR